MTRNPQNESFGLFSRIILPVAIIAVFFLMYFLMWRGPTPLVVYCAHDAVYSEKILRAWERSTGIPVAIKFDTEATKSLGLVELLIREKNNPRCDVFWNNQLLGTAALQQEGILQPYKGEGYKRIPAQFKDPEGHWAGFAARLRVYIINTDNLKPDMETVERVLAGDLSRVAIAKPLYGTTLTHYSVLWKEWGEEKLKAWHKDWRERGVKEVLGNATVKDLVAQGVCDMGLTDTDDFFMAAREGKPVVMLPCRTDNGKVICIPNTVAIINGTRKLQQAKKLVDYLLSEDIELGLNNSNSKQIPLGPVDESRLQPDVKTIKKWAQDAYPLYEVVEARAACLSWLKQEYLK